MEKTAIVQKLQPIFHSVFGNPSIEITDDLSAKDLDNWDSLTHMVLISEVEKGFGITIKLRELNKMKNVGDLIAIIRTKF